MCEGVHALRVGVGDIRVCRPLSVWLVDVPMLFFPPCEAVSAGLEWSPRSPWVFFSHHVQDVIEHFRKPSKIGLLRKVSIGH